MPVRAAAVATRDLATMACRFACSTVLVLLSALLLLVGVSLVRPFPLEPAAGSAARYPPALAFSDDEIGTSVTGPNAPFRWHSIHVPASGLTFSAVECVPAALPAHGDPATALLLHGFPDTYHSFKPQMAHLCAHGYRALSVSLRGYEPSSQPRPGTRAWDHHLDAGPAGHYSLGAMVDDVTGWLDALNVTSATRVHVVGHDWGALLAQLVCAHAPHRFRSLTSLSIPPARRFLHGLAHVPHQVVNSWYFVWFQVPALPEWWLTARHGLAQLWAEWSANGQYSSAQHRAALQAFAQPGVVSAGVDYYRANVVPMAFPALAPLWGSAGLRLGRLLRHPKPNPVPALFVTGVDDGCMAAELFRDGVMIHKRDFAAGVSVVLVPDAGHWVHHDQPDRVNALLLNWLQRH